VTSVVPPGRIVRGAAAGEWTRRGETPIEARDLGLTAATGARLGGAQLRSTGDTSYALDWHRHDNDLHFVYVLDGAFVLEVEDGPVTLTAGGGAALPALLEHREYGFSADFAGIMVTSPAAFDTVWRGGELPDRARSLDPGRHAAFAVEGAREVTAGRIDIRVVPGAADGSVGWQLAITEDSLALELAVGA
jgi:hypothetical protein